MADLQEGDFSSKEVWCTSGCICGLLFSICLLFAAIYYAWSIPDRTVLYIFIAIFTGLVFLIGTPLVRDQMRKWRRRRQGNAIPLQDLPPAADESEEVLQQEALQQEVLQQEVEPMLHPDLILPASSSPIMIPIRFLGRGPPRDIAEDGKSPDDSPTSTISTEAAETQPLLSKASKLSQTCPPQVLRTCPGSAIGCIFHSTSARSTAKSPAVEDSASPSGSDGQEPSNLSTIAEGSDSGSDQPGQVSDLSTPEDEVKTLPKSSTDEGVSSGDSVGLPGTPVSLSVEDVTCAEASELQTSIEPGATTEVQPQISTSDAPNVDTMLPEGTSVQTPEDATQ